MEWRNAFINQHDFHPQPVTGATTMLYALDWIVDRIIEEGMETRQERFRAAGWRVDRVAESAVKVIEAASPQPLVSGSGSGVAEEKGSLDWVLCRRRPAALESEGD